MNTINTSNAPPPPPIPNPSFFLIKSYIPLTKGKICRLFCECRDFVALVLDHTCISRNCVSDFMTHFMNNHLGQSE